VPPTDCLSRRRCGGADLPSIKPARYARSAPRQRSISLASRSGERVGRGVRRLLLASRFVTPSAYGSKILPGRRWRRLRVATVAAAVRLPPTMIVPPLEVTLAWNGKVTGRAVEEVAGLVGRQGDRAVGGVGDQTSARCCRSRRAESARAPSGRPSRRCVQRSALSSPRRQGAVSPRQGAVSPPLSSAGRRHLPLDGQARQTGVHDRRPALFGFQVMPLVQRGAALNGSGGGGLVVVPHVPADSGRESSC